MKAKKLILYIVFTLIVAVFAGCSVSNNDELLRFKLDLIKQGSGEIYVSPKKSSYINGEKVTIEAKAAQGWTFEKWDGKFEGTENPATITLENDGTPLIAVFSDKNATFMLEVNTSGSGSVKVDPELASYLNGTQVTLKPTPVEGWVFVKWDGDLVGSDDPATVFITSNKKITAVFLPEEDVGIQFADPNLEKAVRAIVGKPTGPITKDDVQIVTELDLSTLFISVLDGIQYLTALNLLNLNETGVDDISLMSTLSDIQYLYLNTNEITDISVISNMLELVELDFGDNQIEDISPLIWLWYKNLQVLKLGNNNILDISVLSNLTTLEVLELQNNRVLTIEALAQLQSLRELNLAGNRISDISPISGYFSSINTLEILNLNNNQISDIDNLVWLWENGSLRELYLSGNQISEIRAIHGLTHLEILDLSNNDIIDMGVFKTMTNIRELMLNGNRIEDITNLQNLVNLEKLHLHDNQLIDISILVDLMNLQEVTIMNNPTLDFSEGSVTWDVIQQLKARGVTVLYGES